LLWPRAAQAFAQPTITVRQQVAKIAEPFCFPLFLERNIRKAMPSI
jgi:hypothetical protein